MPNWCVVWEKSTQRTRLGTKVDSPVDVRCRWNIGDQLSVSQEVTQEAYPRAMRVSQQVSIGSYVWGPGKVVEVPDSPQYYEVVGSQVIQDVKGRHPTYRISLQKASKTLPTLSS